MYILDLPPHPVTVANQGLQGFSTKLLCNILGGDWNPGSGVNLMYISLMSKRS